MQIGPPARPPISELAISLTIYFGAIGASLLVGLLISAVVVALIPSGDEGTAFLLPSILNCAILVVYPFLFVYFAANHCRRTPAYFLPLGTLLGLSQTVLLWRRHWMSTDEAAAAFLSAAVGLGLGYVVLRRKQRNFEMRAGAAANSH